MVSITSLDKEVSLGNDESVPDDNESVPDDNDYTTSSGKNIVLSSSENDVESQISDHPIEYQLEKALEVGSIVESLDQVYVLYCEYARCVGFSVKKGTQSYFSNKKCVESTPVDESCIRMKVYHCSCEGFPDKKRCIDKMPKYKKQVLRSDCKARLRVVRKRGGPWIVSVFIKEHNHELLNPDQSYLLRSARNLSHAKKSILEALHSAGVGISQVCRFMEKESGGPQNVGFLRQDAYAHISKLKRCTRIENGDANAIHKHFIDRSNKEQCFHWKVEHDEDGRLMNLFFRDARCAIDYEFFGDVMIVDTTFRTNRYNLICAPFVGLNHHGRNVIFAIAFLSDETTESFEWLFESFLESMDRREPKVIFTDEAQALINGVDHSFRTARHRLCQWHINQNAPRHFGKLNKNKEFKQMWYRCMNHCDTEDEFEGNWAEMVDTYNLKEKSWFCKMYKLRNRWADVFTNHLFSAGMHATSRSEATNKVIKDMCLSSCSLYEFVKEYERLQLDWRRIENEEDAKCRGMPGQMVMNNPLLNHAARVLTRYAYGMFEKEAMNSINVIIVKYPTDSNIDEIVFEVASTKNPQKIRIVQFNKVTKQITCSCHKWDVKGVMCYHMFRILFLLDIRDIPNSLILRRWTRDAKLRHNFCVGTGLNATQSDMLPSMTFVNNLMRNVYVLGQKYMEDSECRQIIDGKMNVLEKELRRFVIRRNRKQNGEGEDAGSQDPFLDPPMPSNRTHPVKRDMNKGKTKVPSTANKGKTKVPSTANKRNGGKKKATTVLRSSPLHPIPEHAEHHNHSNHLTDPPHVIEIVDQLSAI